MVHSLPKNQIKIDYSMYDVKLIKAAFVGDSPQIGWKQNPDPGGEQLKEMTTSESDLWFNDVHPFLTINNLYAVAPDYSNFTYPDWSAATEYEMDDIVSKSSKNYILIVEGSEGEDPETSPNSWKLFYGFTTWLKQKTEAGVISLINRWLSEKARLGTDRNLFERGKLFLSSGNLTDLEGVGTELVGLEIRPVFSRNLRFVIKKIGIQLSANQSLQLYLFKSGTVGPVNTLTPIVYSGGGSEQWEEVNLELKGSDEEEREAVYYLVYLKSELVGQAVNGVRHYDYGNGGNIYFPTGKMFKATAFSHPSAGVVNLWDLGGNVYTASTNYGLNLSIDVRCDYTQFIIDQKVLFLPSIYYQVGINLLKIVGANASAKINRLELNVGKHDIDYIIEGDTQAEIGKGGGLKDELDGALNSIRFDKGGIDKHCLPCRRKGIRFKVI